MHKLILCRENGKRSSDKVVRGQIDHILKRGLTGSRGKGWSPKVEMRPPFQRKDKWVFTFTLTFQKTGRGDAEKQWSEIKEVIELTGKGSKYQPYPWTIVSDGVNENEPLPGEQGDKWLQPVPSKRASVVETGSTIQTWETLRNAIPSNLITDLAALAAHPEFCHLYGLDPQIRTLLSAVQTAIDTGGVQRDHAVCWGHAGCGKTTCLMSLERLLPPGSVLRLDATSTSRAGLEELFFTTYADSPVPPIVYCEEVEKADENGLKIWLGALDDRGELRKMKFRQDKCRKLQVLFICTVNDKRKFDMMMGSDGSEAGALSSRCVTDIYFPRPNKNTLERILQDRIKASGGKFEWVEPALELGYTLGYTDPRKFRSLLAGGDRLLDGSYSKDRIAIKEALAADQKK